MRLVGFGRYATDVVVGLRGEGDDLFLEFEGGLVGLSEKLLFYLFADGHDFLEVGH